MTGWTKALLIGGASAAGVAAIAAAVYFGLPYFQKPAAPAPSTAAITSSSPDFTKAAYEADANGNLVLDSNGDPVPVTGPVHPGDVIEYVLSYNPALNGPATITDTLSANQTYVDSSLQAAGWTYTTPPYSVGNAETYTMAASGPAGFSMTIPAISGLTGNQTGGDGFEPVPVSTAAGVKVFAINHHQPYLPKSETPQIMCWFGASLTPCSSAYPQNSSPGTVRRATADFPHAVIYQKKIYYPAGRYDEVAFGTIEFGLGCWNADTDAACPFVSLPGAPTLNIGNASNANSLYLGTNLDDYLAGLRADPLNPTHAYMYAMGKIYCVDLAAPGMPACTGWTAPTIAPTGTSHARGTDMFADETGTRLFFSNSAGGQGTVRCFNFSDGSLCSGWPLSTGSNSGGDGVSAGATNATALGPGLDAGGNMKAICFSQNFGTAPNFKCFDTLSSANVTGPLAPSWPTGVLSSSVIIAPYHIPATKKVLFPPYYFGAAKCYDFGNAASCVGFTPYWTTLGVGDYGYAVDPVAPQNCIYGYGDGKVLVRFKQDGSAATTDCVPKTYTASFSIDDQFCAKKPKQATWTTLDIVNRPSQLVGGTIVIKDSGGSPIQTITVTAADSYTVNLPATGTSGTVTVEFTPNYGSNGLPATDYQIKLEYTADINPQICYQAKVQDADCAASEVSNHAVYHNADGDKTADVDLGKATGGKLCPSPNCLHLSETITLNPDGTATLMLIGSGPPGFNATEVDVHSNTAGVTVAPPSRSFPPGPFTGTWILTGAAPGQSVDLQVTGVDSGAGTNGADKCCTSDITVVIPPQHREPPTDLGIQKTSVVRADGAYVMGYTYTLSVTNVGAPVNGQNAVTVTDVVPNGLAFTGATGTDWNCTGPFPIAAGGTLTCTYTGSGTLATGQVLPPIVVVAANAVPGAPLPSVTNCADVAFASSSGLTDSNAANNRSCVTNGTQTGPQTDLGIQKTMATHGHGQDILGYTYTLAVTNLGAPVNGQNNVTVTDVVPAGLTFASATGTDWSCPGPFPIAAGGTLTCTYTGSGTLATGQVLPPITVATGSFVPDAVAPPITNCANVAFAAGSGLTDGNASNNHSCASTGTLTVIKVVKPANGHDDSAAVFTANVSCTSPGGTALSSGWGIGPSNNYTVIVSNIVSGAACTISEGTPLPPTGDPANCHWDTTYPDGQQATVPAGNVTVHIVNTEDCTTSTKPGKPGSTVLIAKTVVIDGRVSRAPHQSFPIRATCKEPDGTAVNLGFTASAASGFTSPKQSVPAGTKCTVREPMPPLPRGRTDCHWTTSYLFNGRPASFPVTIGARASNTFGVRNELICEHTDNPADTSCSGAGHWNGKRCVTCERDETWNDRTKACTEEPAPLTCRDPMVLNPAGTACVCPQGTKLKNGECRKSESWFDNVLGHVHVGAGGGHGGGSQTQPHEGK